MTATNNNSPDTDATQRKGATEIKFTPGYEPGKPIFWRIFQKLSNNNNGLISYYNIQERLVSTGQFFVVVAVLMIEHMEKTGKIEKAGDYNVYRIKDSASSNEERVAA
jgi:hypothetical protein